MAFAANGTHDDGFTWTQVPGNSGTGDEDIWATTDRTPTFDFSVHVDGYPIVADRECSVIRTVEGAFIDYVDLCPSPWTVGDKATTGSATSGKEGVITCYDDALPYVNLVAPPSGCGYLSAYELKDGEYVIGATVKLYDSRISSTPPKYVHAEHYFYVDNTAPTGTIKINNGVTRTSTRTVTLNLTTNDTEQGSGVASVRLKNAGGNWTAWQPYTTSKDWKLTRGAGKKTVYVQYRDAAGNVSAKASDSITYRP